jgi:predicted ATP-dependent protease
VLIPDRNEKDLEDVPRELRDVLRIVPVKHMDDVLEHALHPEEKKGKPHRMRVVPHFKLPVPSPRPQVSA